MGDPVPAIAEAEAQGEVAEIYADIRETLGVSLVNLIWRHLATIPGGLEWTWRTAKPIYAEGWAEKGAAYLASTVQPIGFKPLGAGEIGALCVTPEDLPKVRKIIASYDRGNLLNLSALSAVFADPGERLSFQDGADAVAAGADVVIPPILSQGQVAGEVWQTILQMNALGARPNEPVIASVYRHLGYWPALLERVLRELETADADGKLRGSSEALAVERNKLSASLAHHKFDNRPPPPGVEEAVSEFTENVITRLVPITRTLSGWV